MRILFFLACLFLGLSCSRPATENSDAVVADTVISDDAVDYQAQEIEMARRPVEDIRSAFSAPQLKRAVAYVHRRAGLQLYRSLEATNDTTQSVSVLSYGAKVALKEPFVNSTESDAIIIDGLKGRFITVSTPDGDRFIFSGYLSNFPPAEETESLVDYFRKRFHIVAPVDQQRSSDSTDIYIASQYNDIYSFEGGISIEDHGYYEGSGTDVSFPEWVTMQDAFLLARSFSYLKAFSDAFRIYPLDAEKRTVEEGITAEVEMGAEGRPSSVKVIDETGCYDETYVTKVKGKVVLSTGGGC